jgi:NAD(P) transhydrogenase subunit alpha
MAVIAVPKEGAPGEKRVAMVPEVAQRLVKAGNEVRIQSGAGDAAFYPDAQYQAVGAKIVADLKTLLPGATVVTKVQPPTPAETSLIDASSIVVAQMNATRNIESVRALQQRGITAFALELLPRITRAQSMDVLSSQATIAGYRAVLVAAQEAPKLLPMLTTAAGTIRPATVLVLGAGVAGLMAIATAKRLGAVVQGYDVRRAAGEQVRSLGAKFLELPINAEGTGGYARELTPEEKAMESAMVNKAVAAADIVITTANIPGKKAPRLIAKEVVATMKPGAVILDMAAEGGGNCELTQPGQRVVANGVVILGPLNLPADIPFHASETFSKNILSFLGLLIDKTGKLITPFSDEILVASLLTQGGEVKNAMVKGVMGGTP